MKQKLHVSSVFVGAVLALMGYHSANAQPCGEWETQIGQPGFNNAVFSLAVYNDGLGEALYAGGMFTMAGGQSALRIARWDGSEWSELGTGLNGSVNAMLAFNDGLGEALFVGGSFSQAGGASASNIARWNGTGWSPVGLGTNAIVNSLASYSEGIFQPPALFAGGTFTMAGGVAANYIARWSGMQWSAVGGTPTGGGTSDWISAMTVFGDGLSLDLFVGGFFFEAGGTPASRIARWNGTNWAPVGAGNSNWVLALRPYSDGQGFAQLHAGATVSGGDQGEALTRWEEGTWTPLTPGVSGLGGATVGVLTVFEDELYVGGVFADAGGQTSNNVARWNGNTWSSMGSGVSGGASAGQVRAMVVFDDGNGDALFVGGWFAQAGGQVANRIAAWRLLPPCPVDLNNDCALDYFDVQLFLAWFAARDPRADLNGDGEFDFFDVQLFLALFAAGCP